jgi:ketosteroid isomerase-like protein
MQKRVLITLICVLALNFSSLAAPKKMAKSGPSGSGPDKAYLEKLLDGWSAGSPANMAEYYVQGEHHPFFDIAPLKYDNWTEYQNGTTELLKSYKSFKLTLTDDAQVHQEGNLAWSTATIKEDAVTSTGKHEMATLRWTAIFQKIDGKWLIMHEHTSAPLP